MRLIFNKPVVFTLLLMVLCTSTYTYSESNPTLGSVKHKFIGYQQQLTLSVNLSGLTAIVPVDYYRAHSHPKTTISARLLPSEQIMALGVTSEEQLETFLLQNNHHIGLSTARHLARLYIEESAIEGVNPDVAFTQMCLETGFLRFGGDVDNQQHNYCGLGVTGKGEKGLSFIDSRTGVRAHIQHLKAYASTEKLKTDLVDERFRFVERGSAEKIVDLTGKWATDTQYDKKIRSLLHRLGQIELPG